MVMVAAGMEGDPLTGAFFACAIKSTLGASHAATLGNSLDCHADFQGEHCYRCG
jgi:hypothetical protein